MTFCSNQDYRTTTARIAALTLGGSDSHKAWRWEEYRSWVNNDYAWFTNELHGAMGYRADQPEI